MNQLSKQKKIAEKLKELSSMTTLITSISATSSKKGSQNYSKVRASLVDEVHELLVDESKLTIFDKIKKSKGSNGNTIFSKLKFLSKDK